MDKLLTQQRLTLPVLTLRGLVLFPGMILHLDIGRKKSIQALEEAMNNNQTIFFVLQKDIKDEDPSADQIHDIGVVAKVIQVLRQPENSVRILVEGKYRAKIKDIISTEPFIKANLQQLVDDELTDDLKKDALIRKTKETFERYLKFSPKIPPDLILEVASSKNAGKLSDYIASNIPMEEVDKQQILSESDHLLRLEKVINILLKEINILSIENDINQKLKDSIDKNQKEYYLREQIKIISQELGDSDNPQSEAEEFREKIKKLKLKKEVEEPLLCECNKLYKMPQGSHEANVIRTYLDTCLSLPWNKKDKEKIDLKNAKKILDEDHYGLNEIKDRILELIAVRKFTKNVNGQIICFVGPPGVGKTSIAKSIARALSRKYVRVSLGGVKDEADIRGHRRTYIGAMPGRIIDAMKRAGTKNPLMLLDEVDKLNNDFKGDPTSALLEILDSEQNNAFYDHYIDVPFDLSEVLFITTANDYNQIPEPLLDRMEIITLTSYTTEEKFNIAKNYLLPKQLKKHGMTSKDFKITSEAIKDLILSYTRESGVRTLERYIASLLRKSAKLIVSKEKEKVSVTKSNLEDILGPRKFKDDDISKKAEIGVTRGLAWTSVGGETMPIEVVFMPGDGEIELTGSLGDVMKESAKIAISYIRSNYKNFGVKSDFYNAYDIHIHVPEGATPKDGPSAGVTIATSILSALKNVPVKHDIAMTGEITLKGKVLPIGGLKEKTMAAYNAKVKTVIIPKGNKSDLSEIDSEVRKSLNFILVDDLKDVFKNVFVINEKENKKILNSKIDKTITDMVNE